jgi:hypothetical protein
MLPTLCPVPTPTPFSQFPYGTLTLRQFIPDCYGMAATYVLTWRSCGTSSSRGSTCPSPEYWPSSPLDLNVTSFSGCKESFILRDFSTFYEYGCLRFFLSLSLIICSLSLFNYPSPSYFIHNANLNGSLLLPLSLSLFVFPFRCSVYFRVSKCKHRKPLARNKPWLGTVDKSIHFADIPDNGHVLCQHSHSHSHPDPCLCVSLRNVNFNLPD